MRCNAFRSSVLVLVLGVSALRPAIVRAENYAFLVAVQDYDMKDLKPLQFTRSDILEFAKVLEKSGFRPEKMVVMTDNAAQRRYLSEAEKIRAEFELLLAGIKEGDSLVVAFSGHGVQFEGDPKNYFCPIDADLEAARHTKLIALSEIYDRLKECPAEKRLLLVDACRKEPLSPVKKARQTVSLKSVTRPQTEPVPKGVVAVFSCSAGQESYEWPDLKHGVFFHYVLEGWNGAADTGDRKITLNQLINYATDKTQTFARLTLKAAQVPHVKSDFEGTWVLRKLDSIDTPRRERVTAPDRSPEKSSTVTEKAPSIPPRQGRSEAVSLFNGIDLTGWEGDPRLWSVRQGVIIGRNTSLVKVSTYLLTKRKYSDFRLTCQVKLVESEMHSGIAFWGRNAPEFGDKYTYQGHLVMFPSGWGMYDLFRRNSLKVDAGPAKKVGKQHDWNQLEILAQGNRVRLVVNGHLVVDWRDPKPELVSAGPIGLQLHSNTVPQEIHFKDLQLTTFPEDKLTTLK